MPRNLRGPVLGVAAAALVAALVAAVLTAFTARQLSRGSAADQLRDEALAAGRQVAVDFAAYDYRTLARDYKRVLDESTGKFHADFERASTGIADQVVKSKAVSTAEVVGAGVRAVSDTEATVLVALDRTVRNTSVPKGEKRSFGVEITLQHRGDRWLASDVSPL